MKNKNTSLCFKIIFSSLFSFPAFGIINGRDADLQRSAAAVYLKFQKSSEGCSGVVLDAHHILTAGHCLVGTDYGDTKLRLTNTQDKIKAKTVRLQRFYVHPKFSMGFNDSMSQELLRFDMAVLKVSENLLTTLQIPEAALPEILSSRSQLNDLLQRPLFTYGYGRTNSRGNDESGHMKREILLQGHFSEALEYVYAESMESQKGLCQGDSGGGLFGESKSGTLVLLGVTSGITSSVPCGDARSSSYHSLVLDKMTWLAEVLAR